MFIQTIAYIAANVSVKVMASVGFPAYCNSEFENCGTYDTKPFSKNLGAFHPIFLIILFVALASADHLISFLIAHYYPDTAKYWLFEVGSNPLRWIEYSMSASTMSLAIAILCQISDIHIWFLIFVMTAIGMLMGLLLEQLPKVGDKIDTICHTKVTSMKKIIFTLSACSIFIPWLVICCYFFNDSEKIPSFVYVAFLGTLVMFILFGVNSYNHNILGKYNFYRAECVYVILSFTAKTFLACDVFGGLAAAGGNQDE
jgi:hypothetical protein